ncbi:MAG: DUF1553 domain-containing protein [Pirellulaceae bacterium]|nr:DUF1553 domain-containing protein [Pirellulaceae bacterium]
MRYLRTAILIAMGLISLVAVSPLWAAEPERSVPVPSPGQVGPLKFELDIQPILTARGCNSGPCHGKARGQNGFALSLLAFDPDYDYQAIVSDARGRRLFPAAPDKSLFLQKATGVMPHGGGVRIELGDEDYQKIVSWIRGGMPRVSESDPKLLRVEIQPAPHSLAPGQSEQLKVIAHYSNNSQRDVTGTCAYLSNEPAIVSVGTAGQLKAGLIPGEATIMARYMGVIATWSTAIPRAGNVTAAQYAALPRHNFIDDLVYSKLQSLNVLPSEDCGDATFLRRAMLDTIGRLPTPEEARTFLDDSVAGKRERLIDSLLEREEYGDFWANKWADLLRPNPYRVGIKATMSLDGWLRDKFRNNVPYDQFVRELLTAQGSTWRNGAVTLFRDRRGVEELTTIVSQLFLGVRLECAKCHQHPFEVYSQADFYSFGAYFSRIDYKGTGLSPPISGGEEMVLVSRKEKEVRHPLTKAVLPPKQLLGKVETIAEESDPRVNLVDWMTAAENPYFARVAVNRLWSEIFGKGLVDPVDDMRATNPASNPQLLDALAEEFRRLGYDQKKMLKTIMSSHIYALGSMPNETNAADIRNFSRHYRKRMRAEVLADSIVDITEVADSYDGAAPGSRAMQLWTVRTKSDLLDAFGRPDPNQDPPCERMPDATMVQALHLMNANQIQNKLTSDQGRVSRLASGTMTLEQIVEELYLACYSRRPSLAETQALRDTTPQPNPARRQWIEDLLWSLVNSPEFLYIN